MYVGRGVVQNYPKPQDKGEKFKSYKTYGNYKKFKMK